MSFDLIFSIQVYKFVDAGEECNDWPLLTTYKWTDKMFNCSGNITGFVMCKKGYSHAEVGISLWKEGNVYSTIVVYLPWSVAVSDFSDSNYLSFSSGDQLMVVVIYYDSTIRYVQYIVHMYTCAVYTLSQMQVAIHTYRMMSAYIIRICLSCTQLCSACRSNNS